MPGRLATAQATFKGRTMMLGLSLSSFITLHVIISLIAIAAGLVVFYGWLSGWESMNLTHVFLATTVLTTVTGFMLPFVQLLPSHITGFVSIAAFLPALYALWFRILPDRGGDVDKVPARGTEPNRSLA